MMNASERYRNDPDFHQLVDTIQLFYQTGKFSPSELREAATLAATHWEMQRPGTYIWPVPRGGATEKGEGTQ